MQDVLIEMLGNLLWAFFGFAATYIFRLTFRISPTKRLWRLSNPANLAICVATSTKMDTSEYYTPATGIGQIRALALAITSLSRAYKNIEISNVFLSEDQLHDKIEKDVILLGGPIHNTITKKLLEKIKILSIIDHDGHVIIWRPSSNDEARFPPKDEEEKIIVEKKLYKDYGLIIRMKNPFSSSDSTIVLFSGGYTYGTIAAARFFTENMYDANKIHKRCLKAIQTFFCKVTFMISKVTFIKSMGLFQQKTSSNEKDDIFQHPAKIAHHNVSIIVSCDVEDGGATALKLEKIHAF